MYYLPVAGLVSFLFVFAGRRLRFISFRRSPASFRSFSYLLRRPRFIPFRRSPASFHYFSYLPVAVCVHALCVCVHVCKAMQCNACMYAMGREPHCSERLHMLGLAAMGYGAGAPLQRETPHVGARCNGVWGREPHCGERLHMLGLFYYLAEFASYSAY